MSFKEMKACLKKLSGRLWFNIFLKVAAIFAVFVIVITLSNTFLLTHFFTLKNKNMLTIQVKNVAQLDIGDRDAVSDGIGEMSEKYNVDVEIYSSGGQILYTTYGGQMMDFFLIGRDDFSMVHEKLIPKKSETLDGGIVFETAVRRFDGAEFLLCRKEIERGVFAEVRLIKQLITSSAETASEFVFIVALICFAASVVWIIVFARKFSRPISVMNDITRDMARLDFSRRCDTDRTDEIGELSASVNAMSLSLSSALEELKVSNEKLRDEIETERRLDVMRKEFVANVSHELKTPISIISGYAEGLKLNINSESRERYCDTIIDESRRMNELVLGILELSRYESGQIPISKERFEIYPIAERLMERIFEGKSVTAENTVALNTVCFADAPLIEQALKVFLENAAAHTPEGGRVTVKAEDAGVKLRISVFNTGSHIDEEQMPHIWQSFYRGDTSHKREKTRFGLGLSIVHSIMRMHGNACGVYNTSDGVCFWFETENGGNTPSKEP